MSSLSALERQHMLEIILWSALATFFGLTASRLEEEKHKAIDQMRKRR